MRTHNTQASVSLASHRCRMAWSVSTSSLPVLSTSPGLMAEAAAELEGLRGFAEGLLLLLLLWLSSAWL